MQARASSSQRRREADGQAARLGDQRACRRARRGGRSDACTLKNQGSTAQALPAAQTRPSGVAWQAEAVLRPLQGLVKLPQCRVAQQGRADSGCRAGERSRTNAERASSNWPIPHHQSTRTLLH